jgi:hypothetical protein
MYGKTALAKSATEAIIVTTTNIFLPFFDII